MDVTKKWSSKKGKIVMEQFEKVEKIVEKTGVTYEEAKEALAANGDDMLDAVIYLEKKGRANGPAAAHYSTSSEEQNVSREFEQAQNSYEESCKRSPFKEHMHKFWSSIGDIFRKACDCRFRAERDGKEAFSIPVIVLIIAAICAFWLVIILLIVGLFFNYRYSFQGVEPATIDINNMCDKAADTCQSIKNDFQNNKEQ